MINRKKDERILIVDDNVENVRILGLILRGEGYKTCVAMDGYQALRIVEKISPDLILLDVMMPDMNGFETCERLKASPDTADIPASWGVPGTPYLTHLPDIKMKSDKAIWEKRLN